MPDCDGDDYVAGDPERPPANAASISITSEAPAHPIWGMMSVGERIAVVRWLQRGDASRLLTTLAENPTSTGLSCATLEALAGGPFTGWKLRIASSPTGGAPKKAEKALLVALEAAITDKPTDVAGLASKLAGLAIGARARSGPISDPMQAAMVGLSYYAAYECLSGERGDRAGKARASMHKFYGVRLGDKNIQRLITAFRKAGKSRLK